jgi:anti-sigma factor RsiW
LSENCVDPTEIQEGDLMAYVDGVAEEAVVRHVRRCPACARQVQVLAGLGAALTVNLYRHTCPEPDQMIAYQQGELEGNEKLAVAQHLRQCPHCARELADLAREERASLRERLRAAIETLEAVLVPPRAQGAAVGGAGGGRPPPAARVYRAGEIEIILSWQAVWAQPDRWDLSGQVRVEGRVLEMIGGARVELYRGAGLIAIVAVDSGGRFAFAGVEPADYDLCLLWENRDITVKAVQVG